jgi:Uma2 family endonuclease
MSVAAILEKLYTVDEYIAFEETSDVRHEFYFGKLYPMAAGTTDNHNEVKNNVYVAMHNVFRKRGCKVYDENLKVQLAENALYTYPDILLTCDDRDLKDRHIKRYPSLIVEVLSESTAAYDRDGKFKAYQKIPSIQYYLIVESRWQCAELYTRTEKEDVWTYQIFTNPTDIIQFPKIDFSLPFSDIYEYINIPAKLTKVILSAADEDA